MEIGRRLEVGISLANVKAEAKNTFESDRMDASRDRQMIATCINQFISMADLAGTLNGPAR